MALASLLDAGADLDEVTAGLSTLALHGWSIKAEDNSAAAWPPPGSWYRWTLRRMSSSAPGRPSAGSSSATGLPSAPGAERRRSSAAWPSPRARSMALAQRRCISTKLAAWTR